MPFKYPCFISYRHGQKALVERIINDLYAGLSSELESYFPEDVYLDRKRLQGGVYYESELAQALCESVCLIVVFTPVYLHPAHPYCARELRAMEILERARFQALEHTIDASKSLIIPIVFRGASEMPETLKCRQYYDFQDFDPTEPQMIETPKYYDKIKKIALYIRERYHDLSALDEHSNHHCKGFKIPSADTEEVKNLCISSRPSFPNRKGVNR